MLHLWSQKLNLNILFNTHKKHCTAKFGGQKEAKHSVWFSTALQENLDKTLSKMRVFLSINKLLEHTSADC